MPEATKTSMYAPKNPPGSNLKGGGLRGGPKRWTGNGPRPARHIPWPEIFKHHISVIEGHHKMIDMVRKHTVPETGNWRTICDMVERTNEMLRMSKNVSKSFIPAADHRDQVPIGSSSASMYPGYSPADHKYGDAAVEFGNQIAAAKAQGANVEPAADGPEYEIGRSRLQRKKLAGIRAIKAERGEGSRSGAGSGSDTGAPAVPTNEHHKNTDSDAAPNADSNPYFVIDSNPTPVNLPGISQPPPKREAEEEATSEPKKKKSKKSKLKQDSNPADASEKAPDAAATAVEKPVEFEDISAEVDARMKEKEEKRKRKEEKKRKRESAESVSAAPEPVVATGEETVEVETERPKKKKAKKASDVTEISGNADRTKKRKAEANGDEPAEGEGGLKKKKKKAKKEA